MPPVKYVFYSIASLVLILVSSLVYYRSRCLGAVHAGIFVQPAEVSWRLSPVKMPCCEGYVVDGVRSCPLGKKDGEVILCQGDMTV